MKMIIGLLIFITTSPVFANYFNPEWESECNHMGNNFKLHFESKSKDATNDDMQVSVLTTKNSIKMLAFPEALYVSSGLTSSIKNLCRSNGVAAFPISETKILFFISKDNRPFLKTLVLALIDVENGLLVDFLDTDKGLKGFGESPSFTIKEKGGKLNIRLATEYMKNTENDSIDNYIESWVEVSVISNKISINY
jgi:hypothetical protein